MPPQPVQMKPDDKPIAELKVKLNIAGGGELYFSLYEGHNILGKGSTCHIQIPRGNLFVDQHFDFRCTEDIIMASDISDDDLESPAILYRDVRLAPHKILEMEKRSWYEFDPHRGPPDARRASSSHSQYSDLDIAEETQSMEDIPSTEFNRLYEEVFCDEEGDCTRVNPDGRLLPPELTHRNQHNDGVEPTDTGSDLATTQPWPLDSQPSESAELAPTQLHDPSQWSVGDDTPTQPHRISQVSLDPDAPTQTLDTTLDFDEAQAVMAKSELAREGLADRVPESQTMPQTILATELTTEVIEDRLKVEASGSLQLPVADLKQEDVTETRLIHQDDAEATQSPIHSREASPEREPESGSEQVSQVVSQLVSQVFSVASSETIHRIERIPATPLEELVKPGETEREKTREQIIEEEGKVPQTPEDNQHTGMSQVSTVDNTLVSGIHGSSLDSTDVNKDEDNESVVRVAASFEDENDAVERTSYMSKIRPSRDLDSDEDVSMVEATQPLGEALKNTRRTQTSSLPQEEVRVGQADEGESNVGAAAGSTRPSSRTSLRSKEGSPKHGMESDSGESTPKPSKLIRTESTDETLVPVSHGRTTPSRMLSRRSTVDIESHRHAVMVSAPAMNDKGQWKGTIENLGGTYKEDWQNATVLAFEGASRTWKLMCAIALGIPIVSLQWLKDSKARGRFLPCDDYIFEDPTLEKKYGFKLAESSALARTHQEHKIKLFQDYNFYIVCPKGKSSKVQAKKGQLTRELADISLRPMIEVCGGKILKLEPRTFDDNIIVIGPDTYCAVTQQLIQMGLKAMKVEFILSTILHQHMDLHTHKIEQQTTPSPHENDGDDDGNLSTADEAEDEDDNDYQESDDEDKGQSEVSDISSRSRSRGKTVVKRTKVPRAVSRSMSTISATGISGRTKTISQDDSESMAEASTSSVAAATNIKTRTRAVRTTKKKTTTTTTTTRTTKAGSAVETSDMEQVEPRATISRKSSKGSSSSNKIPSTDVEESEASANKPATGRSRNPTRKK
ncbi:Mediator of DNA damage checkpoint protein 1 [Mortierella claussenii]|nr:Mediator of DNA damage checkpoint protein 1 [Mortierella claussenii]